MRPIFRLVAALAVGFAASTGQGAVLSVDNFNTPSVTLFDPIGSDGIRVVYPNDGTRSLTHELLAPANPASTCVFSCVQMGGATFPAGQLGISNEPVADSQVTASWNLVNGFVPLNTPTSIFFEVIQSDGNPINALLSFGGPLTNLVIPGNTVNGTLLYGLTLAQSNALSGGGVLTLTLDGIEGWDLRLDSFGFVVPEPATLTLTILALLGVGVTSRRRRA